MPNEPTPTDRLAACIPIIVAAGGPGVPEWVDAKHGDIIRERPFPRVGSLAVHNLPAVECVLFSWAMDVGAWYILDTGTHIETPYCAMSEYKSPVWKWEVGNKLGEEPTKELAAAAMVEAICGVVKGGEG